MKNKPFLSIIVPVFNVENYLPQCLDSILNCSFQSYEIILVIGQSADQSNYICYKYESQYTKILVITQSGNGLSNARNCGLDVAKGLYIMYIDSDDFIDSNAFNKTMQLFYLLKNKNLDILVSDFLLVNSKNEIYKCRKQIKNTPYIIEDPNYLKSFLSSKGNYWNVWRFLYRREFLLENNITFKENYKSEDIDYSTKVLLTAKTCSFYHNPYYCYRVRRNGSLVNVITMQNVVNLLDILSDSIKEISNKTTFPYSTIIKNKLLLEYIYSFLLINDIDKKYRNETYAKIYSHKRILKETTCGKFILFIISILGVPLISLFLFHIRKIYRLMLRLQ
jgi:glycosyltransferase involved in cell wall biosynthesis